MFKKLVLASHNPGKLREFSALLSPLGIEVIPQSSLNIPEAEEPHFTFVENALAKARHAAERSGLPALADDSGLCVEALGGAPGVFSARYAGEPKSDERNNAALLAAMVGEQNRSAHYVCALVLVREARDPQPLIGLGRWHGSLTTAPRGESGFGYDPLFWLPDHHCTVAELDAQRKNQISHRALALESLLAQIREGA
ncbi:MAG: RdgB/HAM1 family non-canonical purine pyrophosphatase [Pseudomonadota bacterium]|jgi:XTP/dITP diphosphohydrolase